MMFFFFVFFTVLSFFCPHKKVDRASSNGVMKWHMHTFTIYNAMVYGVIKPAIKYFINSKQIH